MRSRVFNDTLNSLGAGSGAHREPQSCPSGVSTGHRRAEHAGREWQRAVRLDALAPLASRVAADVLCAVRPRRASFARADRRQRARRQL